MTTKPIQFGFWKEVRERAVAESRPIFVLAPMADVTDAAFRRIIAKYGKPDVTWTEFVSADGLCSPGREALLHDLEFSEAERPIVAQLFTSHPEKMLEAARLCVELGFDGIDINMGCPDRSVEKQCAGAAMMKDPELAHKVIEAAREGAKSDIPVSVKTRIGYNKIEIDTWIRFLLGLRLPVLTVHLRTRKEMSDVPAHWELMPEIMRLRDEVQADVPPAERTIVLGNGDVTDLADARIKIKPDGVSAEGVMFGRAIFGNPWLFDQNATRPVSVEEKLRVMVEHTELFEKLLGGVKNFAIMKKHYKAYVNGWDGAKELRAQLMEATNAAEVRKIVDQFLFRFQ
jgi:nifR3 family TIM-barrel protein